MPSMESSQSGSENSLSFEQNEKLEKVNEVLNEVEQEVATEEKKEQLSKPGWWEKNIDKVRKVVLAASLSMGSFVAVGCDKSSSVPEKPTGQETRQTDRYSEMKRAVENQRDPVVREKLRDGLKKIQEMNNEEQKSEQWILRVAERKGLINAKSFANTEEHKFNFYEIAKIPVEATIDGVSIPLSHEDYSQEELKELQSVANLLSVSNGNQRSISILQKLGITDQQNFTPTPQEQTQPTSQEKASEKSASQGSDYDKHIRDW